jgi:1-acyl-sn-glycerol-3-phosphate acyltransferase
MYKNTTYDNKILNYVCYCKKYFYNKDKLVSLQPCNHLIHDLCINEYISNNQYEHNNIKTIDIKSNNNAINKTNNKMIFHCPICKTVITSIIKENKILKTDKANQLKTDIQSIKLDDSIHINYQFLPISLIKFTSFMNKLLLVNSDVELFNTLEYLLRMCKIKINVIDNTKNNPIEYVNNTIKWKNKKDVNSNIVLISNHTHYFDSFVLFYLFKSGFVSSDFINKTDIGKIIASKCNLLIFKRGQDTNMVDKIRSYLEEKKIIVMYPEGGMGNPNTLLRFRTGAFYTGSPVCPIIIKYNPYVWDDDLKKLIFKLITQSEITVDVYVNDLVYPPFNDEIINKVREFMAKVGNLKLSRVSNKNVKE